MSSSILSDIESEILKYAETRPIKNSDVVNNFDMTPIEARKLLNKLFYGGELNRMPDTRDHRSYFYHRVKLPDHVKKYLKRYISKQKRCDTAYRKYSKSDFTDENLKDDVIAAEREKEEIWKAIRGNILPNNKTFAEMLEIYPDLAPSYQSPRINCVYCSPRSTEIISLYEKACQVQ
ncbi:MAG: hypothetical protein ACFFD4_35120 [Candidatus Odinarchaeota archaeon]